jgi:vancomycin aglycone glucosyltransferase
MLTLAAAFERKGHEVLVCAPPDFREDTESRGLRFHPVGRDVRSYLEGEAKALHGGAIAMTRAGERFFLDNVGAQLRDLLDGAEGADLLIAAGTQITASSVAEHVGARYRFVCYDPALLRSAEQPPAFLPFADMPRWLVRPSWTALERLLNLRVRPALDRERKRLGLPPVADLYTLLRGERPIFAGEELLAPIPPDVGDVQTIGCLHPFEEAPLPEKLDAFLASGEPPVYVGFGSMTDPDPKGSTRMVLDALRRAGVRAVLSAGWAGLGDDALPSDVMSVGSTPHASLFPRVAAVIHHGGAGTTTMAARAGAPQILAPHVLDQFHWSRRVRELGLGPPAVARRKLTAEKLANAIRSVRDNEVLTERAREIGARLRAAMEARPDPADVLV